MTDDADALAVADSEGNLSRLVAHLEDGRLLVPFVGAGLSKASDYPTWAEFLLREAGPAGLESAIREHLARGEFEEAAEALSAGVETFFADRITETYADAREPSGPILMLPRLSRGAVVTTNFDHALERTFFRAGVPFEREVWGAKPDLIRKALHERRRYLLKIHGDAEDRDDRVFTLAQYEQRYGAKAVAAVDLKRALPNLLASIFERETLLFIGCSLANDRTMQLFRRVISERADVPMHFAIVQRPAAEEARIARRQQLLACNIRPIWYPENEHSAVAILLEHVVAQAALPPLPPIVEPSPKAVAAASRRRLQPIFVHDYLSPRVFVSRTAELSRLAGIADAGVDPATGLRTSVVAIHALGGMGKSALARALVDRVVDRGGFGKIVWFSFYESQTREALSFCRLVARHLGVDVAGAEGDSTGDVAAARLGAALADVLASTRVLLVLDGLEVIQDISDERSPRYGAVSASHDVVRRLLERACNDSRSFIVVTTRVALRAFAQKAGYLDVPLTVLDRESAASLLESLGVAGTLDQLLACADHFRGHPLTLRAAGLFMARHGLHADRVKDLIGDPAIFRRTSEGEKVVRILDAWKSRLSRDQLRFLRLLGIHPRAVSEDSFKVLVWHYGRRGRDRGWAARTIVDPLVDAGLIERLEAADGRVSYSAHPLMKFGFSAWLGARRSRNAHREWATAAIGRPDHSIVFAILHIDTLEEIQPYLDAVEHYIAAADFATAWEIYDGAGLHRRLHEIGHESTLRDVMTKFEEAAAGGQWTPQAITLEAIYRCLATSSSALDDRVGLRLYEPRRYDASLRTGDLFLIAASGASLVETSLDEGWMEKAAEQLESLRKRLAGGSPAADLSPVHAAEVKAALLAGEYARTIGFADRVLTRKLVSHDEFVVRVRAYKARALIGVGEVADGLALFQETKSAHINRRDQQSILSWMVDAELRQGNVEAAERYDEEQRAVARSLGFAPRPAFGILLARGDFDAARADIDRWRAGVHEGEGPGSGIRIDIAAAQLLAARDHVDEARRLAADVRGRMDACGYRLGWELLQPMLETERP